jgi:MoxR-like ATPase
VSVRPITPRMKWAIYSWTTRNTTLAVDHHKIAQIEFEAGKKIIGFIKGEGDALAVAAALAAALRVPRDSFILKDPGPVIPKAKEKEEDDDEETEEAKEEGTEEEEPKAKPIKGDAEIAAKLKEIEDIFKRREAEAKRKAEEEAKKKGGVPQVKVKTPDYVPPVYFSMVAHVVKNGGQVLLSGPAGSGKSRLAYEVARALDLNYHFLPVGGGVRYRQIFGGDQIVGGETRWEPGPLLRWIQEPGVILIDEIFGADPDVLLGLNPLLESSTRSIQTPTGEIKMHPDCRIMAAANTLGRTASHRQYTGAQRADDSLLDRFLVQPCDYDPSIEKKILEGMGMDEKAVADLTNRAFTLREKIKSNQIAFDLSTRRIIQAARLMIQGLNLATAVDLAITNSLTKTERARVM